ncbi:MAG: oxidoreductase [Deltaproteobacteria bacterium]|nr:oxidoreductase [Deltaproteobacteria bacterium]
MTDKPKIAVCWLASCAGCDEAVVDLNEAILPVAEAVDIVLWPIALDFKYDHLESFGDKELALGILHGAVRNSEQEELAKLMRSKSKVILAFGSCACFGGTVGLANFRTREDIFKWVYHDAPTVANPEGRFPQTETRVDGKVLTLPEFYDRVYTLDQVIDVDYYLPGCPPPPDLVLNAINAVVSGNLPPKGSTLAPRTALCDTCPRNRTKPERIEITTVKRIHEVEADPETCFLVQGIICLGFAIRSGCGETCIRVNTPCRGCFGPVPGVTDAGTKALSALNCLIKAGQYGDPRELMESIDDPAGYCYRFSQPSSILGRKRRVENV